MPRVAVTLRTDVDGDDESVVALLTGSGLAIEEIHVLLGVLVGVADDDAVERLRSLPIVVAVDLDPP